MLYKIQSPLRSLVEYVSGGAVVVVAQLDMSCETVAGLGQSLALPGLVQHCHIMVCVWVCVVTSIRLLHMPKALLLSASSIKTSSSPHRSSNV